MREHTRIYQHLFSKTNSTIISSVGTAAARTAAMAAVKWTNMVGKKRTPVALEIAENRLQNICSYDENSSLPSIPYCHDDEDKNDGLIDVSVIVPVHNGEKYLAECMNSIFNQAGDYFMQLIVINDHSTDLSPQILAELQNKFPFDVYVPENGGSAGRARNEGLRHATGRYVIFVDCDDVLPPNAIRELYEEIEYCHADIVQGSWKYLQDDGRGSTQYFWPHQFKDYRTNSDRMQLPGMPWGKIYRRTLFDRIRFPESVPCYEDAIIHNIIFSRAKEIRTIGNIVYEWRRNPNGLTSSTQGTERGVNAYWVTKEIVKYRHDAGLTADDLWYRNLTLQLSCYCYPCVREMTGDRRQKVFDACCALYRQEFHNETIGAWFMANQIERWAAKALETGNYKLWELCGRFYPILM